MRRWIGMFTTAIFCGGMLFGASGQIRLVSNSDFRLYSNGAFLEPGAFIIGRDSYANGIMTYYGHMVVQSSPIGGGGLFYANGVNISGPLYATGPKSFIHPHPTDDTRAIRYVAIESSEVLTVARGTARTQNGQVTITLPEHFSMVTSRDEPLTVLLTPNGAPVLLYTTHVSRERITVAMRNSDLSEFRDVEFSYQITGVRDGFENQDVVISVDELFDRNTRTSANQSDAQRRVEAFEERLRAIRTEMVDEKIRMIETERGEKNEN